MANYFTSDLHFGHLNIIEYVPRPFHGVDHMNEEMVRRWNETVTPDDHVTIVGDFAMGRIEETLPIAARLNGDIELIPGNHDRCWMGHDGSAEKRRRWEEEYGKYFTITHGPVVRTVDGIEVLINHFGYVEISRHGDRYSAHRSNYEGLWLIHGHTHQKTTMIPEHHEVHVGVDAWDYAPVHEEWIGELIRSAG